MQRYIARHGRPPYYADDISSVLSRGYTWFSVIRCIFRVGACIAECVMLDAVALGSNRSNAKEKFNINTLATTTLLCIICWMVKLGITCVDCCRCNDFENISEYFSLITLWIGEIPKTVCHLIIAHKHTHAFHRNHPIFSSLLTCFKLVERLCGYFTKYDWKEDKWPLDVNALYIAGIIAEPGLAFFSIASAFK